jgi:hypothetical protein
LGLGIWPNGQKKGDVLVFLRFFTSGVRRKAQEVRSQQGDPPASPEGEADGGQARRWGETETRREKGFRCQDIKTKKVKPEH